MIVTKIIGGLGNQLFQYAFARDLSLKKKVNLKLDLSDFKKYKPINIDAKNFYPGILQFRIKSQIAKSIDLFYFYPRPIFISKIIKSISNRGFSLLCSLFNKGYFFEINYFKKYSINLKTCKNFYFHGFWQNEEYFKDSRKILIKELRLKKLSKKHQKLLQSVRSKNSVSLHVRRGERTNNKYKKMFPMPSKRYFLKSIKLMNEKIKNPKYYIFSDDMKWVKKNLKIKNAIYINNFKDYEDLITMSKCSHNIISNSTFSWWAAWLNTNDDKIIISPKKWTFINKKPFNPCLTEWLRV